MGSKETKTNETLRYRVFRAGGWVMGGHGTSQLIRLASNLVMTRLLVPEMFGLMAVAWLFMTGIQLVSDVGLRQSIVRSDRSEDPVFRGTAWTMQIMRGALLWLVGMLSAIALYMLQTCRMMPVGSVYNEPLLGPVIGVLSIVALFSGFESTRIALSERNLVQKKVVLLDLIAQLAGMVCMIGWALMERSIWTLVAGGVVSSAARMVLSHAWLRGAPDQLHWDKFVAADLFHFGKWVFLTSSLGFAVMSGDRLLLAGMVSAELLGLYAIAFLIVDAVAQLVSKLQASVAFPALSEVARHHPSQLKENYYKFRRLFDVVTLFCCGLLFVSGSTIVGLLFDDRYQGAGGVVEVLAASLFFVRFGVAEMLCLVLNRPAVLSVQMMTRGVALFVGTPVFYGLFGFIGAAWAIALHRVFSLIPIFHFKIRNNLLDLKKEVLPIPALLLGSGVGYFFVYLFPVTIPVGQ